MVSSNMTLSELIKLCGENFFELVKTEKGWRCSSSPLYSSKGNYTFYQTPEEAVENTLLELNKYNAKSKSSHN